MTLPSLIPREVLFGNPEKVGPQISPDGKRMSYIAPLDGVLNVWVGTAGADDFKPVTRDTGRGVQIHFWAHDNRHLLYVQDKDGDENFRLYGIDLDRAHRPGASRRPDSGDSRCLTPFDNVRVMPAATSKRHPNDVLLAINKDNPQLHDLWHLDLRTGEVTKRLVNPGFLGWIVDNDMRPRGGMTMGPDGGLVVVVDDKPVYSFDPEDALGSGVVGFAPGGGLYLMSSKDANASRLVEFDFASGSLREIFADPIYDVSGVMRHPDTYEIQMVSVLRDRVDRVVLDDSIRADIEAIEKVQHGDFFLTDRDHADRTWLFGFSVDDGPVPYYVWDRAEKRAAFLFVHRPELAQHTLAHMEPFSFTSRDGLEVHGYLTFPPGLDRRSLPTVLNVHGGPWGRDAWGLDPEAQWLANRGYLCVQVNFRGSTGYGKAFTNAGDREWGAKMHDDLIDGVRFVVEKGWTDASRVAIYGGSYGGYAALVGATFTPDVFCCAVDVCGPSNIKTLIESVPPYWAPQIALFHRRVGNPATDEEFLWSRSPLSKVDEIRIPMLVVQGANDPRVKQAESDQIVEAMKAKGIDHEYLLFPDEGHGMVRPENRLKFYTVAEKFLAQHLGGRFED